MVAQEILNLKVAGSRPALPANTEKAGTMNYTDSNMDPKAMPAAGAKPSLQADQKTPSGATDMSAGFSIKAGPAIVVKKVDTSASDSRKDAATASLSKVANPPGPRDPACQFQNSKFDPAYVTPTGYSKADPA